MKYQTLTINIPPFEDYPFFEKNPKHNFKFTGSGKWRRPKQDFCLPPPKKLARHKACNYTDEQRQKIVKVVLNGILRRVNKIDKENK